MPEIKSHKLRNALFYGGVASAAALAAGISLGVVKPNVFFRNRLFDSGAGANLTIETPEKLVTFGCAHFTDSPLSAPRFSGCGIAIGKKENGQIEWNFGILGHASSDPKKLIHKGKEIEKTDY